MSRGLILFCTSICILFQGCGERLNSLKLISSDFFHDRSGFLLDENYSYIKLQVNSNDFSYLALGYIDSDASEDLVYVWYSSDKHVLRTKLGRLHSISSVSPLWYGQKYLTNPKNVFSNTQSFQRIRFGIKSLDIQVKEIVSISNHKIPYNFKKFCNLGEKSEWISEVSVDQFGNVLKSFYGLTEGDSKKIQCVYQELDDKNIIKWVHIKI